MYVKTFVLILNLLESAFIFFTKVCFSENNFYGNLFFKFLLVCLITFYQNNKNTKNFHVRPIPYSIVNALLFVCCSCVGNIKKG